MTSKGVKNVPASVLSRLRKDSRSSGAPFQQVLQLYAMERFLDRISKSVATARAAGTVSLQDGRFLKIQFGESAVHAVCGAASTVPVHFYSRERQQSLLTQPLIRQLDLVVQPPVDGN